MANLKVDLSLNDGNLKQQINADKQAVKDFGKSVGEQAQNFSKVVGSITNYKRKLSELTKEVISLEMSYANLSDEQKKSDIGAALAKQLNEAKEKAAQFKDQIADTAAEIKQLSSDSFKTDALSEGISTVSTSMSAMVAVTQLAGGETEKLQKAIAQLILIQTASAASVKIINALQAQSALMLSVRKVQEAALAAAISVRTAAEGRGIIATKAATVAQAAFNAIAKANPYVLLATAVAAVGVALYAFASKSDEATEAEKKRQKELENSKRKTEMMEDVQKSYTSALASTYAQLMTKYTELAASYKSLTSDMQRVQWIKTHQKELDELGLKVKDVKDAENVFNGNTDAIVEAFKARAKSAALAAKATALYTKQIELEQQFFNRYNQVKVQQGDAAPSNMSSFTADRTGGTYNGGKFTYNQASGKFAYTAKGAAEANAELAKTDATLLNIQSDYNDINAEINETVGQMAQLAQTAKTVQQTTNKQTSNTHTSNKPTFAAGSLSDLENQLSELQKKYKDGLITLTPSDYQKKVNDLTKAIESKKIELGLYVPEDKIAKQLQSLTEKNDKIARQQTFSSFDVAVGNDKPNSERDLSYIQSQMNFNDSLIKQLQDLQAEYAKLGEKGADAYKLLGDEIESTKAKQTELGESAKTITSENKRIQENAEQWGKVGSMVGEVGSAFSSLGSSFKSPELNIAGIIAQAIASIISAYTQAAASPTVTSTGWGMLGFAISGLATVASVIAQIHSLSGYAQGGIVSGGSYVGDSQIIRVNSGEAVLTQSDQSRFMRLLDGGSVANQSQQMQYVGAVVRGADLYLAFSNYAKQQKAVGKNIGIR